MPENNVALMFGITIAVLLLVVGILLGLRLARRRRNDQASGSALKEGDGERVLQLLQDFGAWTSEYSGNVSEYSSQLGELSHAVAKNAGQSQAENRVMMLLSQIMDANGSLQKRLDAAERTLEKQTRQIESYLTEARTDGLTGLSNRRAFDQKLEEMFKAFRNGGRSFVVVLFDIDKFKSINDNYGHQAGDQVLQQLARTLGTELQDALIVARFGGEEFAAILDGPLRTTAEKLNTVRKSIAARRLDAGGTPLEVTVSVGVSEPRADIAVGPVLRRADEALYAAKNIGRNRVYYHDGKTPVLVGAPEIAR